MDLKLWHLQILLCDVLVGVLTLQFFKVEAYWDFIKNLRNLQAKKVAFNREMKKHHSDIGIIDVINNFRMMLKYQQVIKLN